MPADWQTLEPDDVLQYIDATVAGAANVAMPTGSVRLKGILDDQVQLMRGACRTSGRQPLSIQPNSIPPEAVKHTLVLTALALSASVPNLAAFFGAEDEGKPFRQLVSKAESWLEKARTDGTNFSPPTDPDPDFVLSLRTGIGSDTTPSLDLSTGP